MSRQQHLGTHLLLPPERLEDPEWTNLRLHDIQERWDVALAPWVAAEHAARMNHALNVIASYAGVPCRVLDVGCAQGTLGHLLSERSYQVTLVDFRESHIEYARHRSDSESAIHYCVGLVPLVPAEDGFDLVICTEVIEHMPAAQDLLIGLKAKCRVGGTLYLTTPNGSYAMSRMPRYSRVSEQVLASMAVNSDDGDDHRFAYTLDELIAIIRGAGFAIREAGVWLPYWVVGYAKTKWFHNLHFRVVGRPIVHYPWRRRSSCISRALGTSLYLVAERTS